MGGGRVLRRFVRIVAFVGFIVFFVVGVLTSKEVNKPTKRSFKYTAMITGSERHNGDVGVVHPTGLDPNSMSNRKVPNGPDPIHNRRAGNSGRPPRQA
ncbi:hypothetical protein MKX01_024282 [Papaver californicum]|nr:hypothetical protein MKX01_024282 [Papaver californicum]